MWRKNTHPAIQVEDGGAIIDCNLSGGIHPQGVAANVICQPRDPPRNKEEEFHEMNREQSAAEGWVADRGGNLDILVGNE